MAQPQLHWKLIQKNSAGSLGCFSTLNSSQRGGALIYILIAIALLGALTASFIDTGSQTSRTQNAIRLSTELEGQVNLIRSAIQECILVYPSGDSTVDNVTNDPGYHAPFPVNPDSAHFTGSADGADPNRNVEYLRCPGNSSGAANDHVKLFSGTSGRFMPPAPALMNDWTYFNGAATISGEAVDGVYFMTSTTNTDPYLADALTRLEGRYADCEADYIDGDGTNGCANNTQCFRVWSKRVTCP